MKLLARVYFQEFAGLSGDVLVKLMTEDQRERLILTLVVERGQLHRFTMGSQHYITLTPADEGAQP